MHASPPLLQEERQGDKVRRGDLHSAVALELLREAPPLAPLLARGGILRLGARGLALLQDLLGSSVAKA